jgi:hypothetical protein
MMHTWALTDDWRCPQCFGPCEVRVVEMESEEGEWQETQVRCLDCAHTWIANDP